MVLSKKFSFSGNTLKLIALVCMTVDHIGMLLLINSPYYVYFRLIGRLAFPIFAYMVAEGCKYTKNIKKYLLTNLSVGVLWQTIYMFLTRDSGLPEIRLNILLTFSLSISVYYLIHAISRSLSDRFSSSPFVAVLLGVPLFFILEAAEQRCGVCFDYGFVGVMLPVVVSLFDKRSSKLLAFSAWLGLLSASIGGIQVFCLLSVPLVALYGGGRGKLRLKYLFYVYYPLHLLILYLISM